ncbi:MAG: Hsp20/alpha crystallin family protein [Methylococcaceae bacterium]
MSSDIETVSVSPIVSAPVRTSSYQSSVDDLDQWFEDIRRNWLHPFFPGRTVPEWSAATSSHLPRLDIIDRDDHFCVRAELPGVDKDSLDVSLQDNVLSIQAASHRESQEEKGRFCRRELFHGEFQRVVRLPVEVEAGQVKANFKDGILELNLPKSPGTRRQTISVD